MKLPNWVLKQQPSYKAADRTSSQPATRDFTLSRIEKGRVVAGGRGFLTENRQLVFEPLDSDPALKILRWGGLAAGISGAGIVKKAIDSSGMLQPKVVSLKEATSVEVLDGTWRRPPVVKTTLAGGRSVDIGVLADPRYTNKSHENRRAADEFASRVRALCDL